jgi:hypothetical protein
MYLVNQNMIVGRYQAHEDKTVDWGIAHEIMETQEETNNKNKMPPKSQGHFVSFLEIFLKQSIQFSVNSVNDVS